MHEELGKVCEVLVDELEGFGVVARELDFRPPFGGKVGSFDLFDVQVEAACGRVGTDCRISRIRKRTGLSAAHSATPLAT